MRVDVAEHHGGIGHGRRSAAPAIAGGAGVGACARRPDAQQPARIDPGDGPAAGADAPDIDRGEAEIVAGEEPAEPSLAGVFHRAVAHHAHVEGGAAGIHHQHVGAEPFRPGVGDAGERRHRRARLDHEDRPVGDILHVHQPAGDRADQQLAGEAGGAEVVVERAQVALHQRLQRGVDGSGRRTRILAQDRVEPVRERVGNPWHRLLDQGAQPLLVRRILDRPEQADGDRLHPLACEPGQRLPGRVLVERPLDLAFGRHPLRDLGREPARHVGLEGVDMELEGMQLAALAVDQDVRKAFGHQQRGPGGGAGDDGVGRPGGAVDQHLGRPDQRLEGEAHGAGRIGEARLDPVGAARRRGRRLADGERAAGAATTTSVKVPPVSTAMR